MVMAEWWWWLSSGGCGSCDVWKGLKVWVEWWTNGRWRNGVVEWLRWSSGRAKRLNDENAKKNSRKDGVDK